MAASINYKTFYADEFGTGIATTEGGPGNGSKWNIRSNPGSTGAKENSSENIMYNNQTTSGQDVGIGLTTVQLLEVPSSTIWSIEKFNIALERQINVALSSGPTNRNAYINYTLPNYNYDQFSIVLKRGGGSTEIPLINKYKLQLSPQVPIGSSDPNLAWERFYTNGPLGVTTNLFSQSISLSDRSNTTSIPYNIRPQTNIGSFPNLYQLNLEAADVLEFRYGFRYYLSNANYPEGASASNWVLSTSLNVNGSITYTPTWKIYMSGIEHVTA